MSTTSLVQSFNLFAEKQQLKLVETLAEAYGFDVADAMKKLAGPGAEPKKRGRPAKKATVVQESNDGDDLVSELIQSSNEEKPDAPKKRKTKMTPEEREAKKQETIRRREEKKAADKQAKAEARAKAKAEKEALKQQEREAAKAAKQQEREAAKALKKQEREAAKALKKQEREAAKANSPPKKGRGRKAVAPENFDSEVEGQEWVDMTPSQRASWKRRNPIQKKEQELPKPEVETAAAIELQEEPIQEEEEQEEPQQQQLQQLQQQEEPAEPMEQQEEQQEEQEEEQEDEQEEEPVEPMEQQEEEEEESQQEDNEEESEVVEVEIAGETYYRDEENLIYTTDSLESDEPTPIGKYNEDTGAIDPIEVSDDEDENN